MLVTKTVVTPNVVNVFLPLMYGTGGINARHPEWDQVMPHIERRQSHRSALLSVDFCEELLSRCDEGWTAC
jgi:hypothetical protein